MLVSVDCITEHHVYTMPRRRKKGKSVKRNAAQSAVSREEDFSKAPHSFVVHKGNSVGKSVQELVRDFRRVMEPNTASNIKVRPKQGEWNDARCLPRSVIALSRPPPQPSRTLFTWRASWASPTCACSPRPNWGHT